MALPIVTPMTLDDLDAIMVLERQCFRDPWTRHMYVVDLTQNNLATFLVLRPSIGSGGEQDGRPGEQGGRPQGPPLRSSRAGEEAERELPPVLAYGGFWLLVDEAHIATIASHPDWRGCGLAQLLMLALLDAAIAGGAIRSTLEVRVSNLPARRLYEKLGYQIVGIRPRYYRDGEDGLIMTTPDLAEATVRARLAAVRDDSVSRSGKCFGGSSEV
jgi:ribosomal-protein-alanine N-acetyltransferase